MFTFTTVCEGGENQVVFKNVTVDGAKNYAVAILDTVTGEIEFYVEQDDAFGVKIVLKP